MPVPLVLHAARGAVDTTASAGVMPAMIALLGGVAIGSALALLQRPGMTARLATAGIWLLALVAVGQAALPYDHILEVAPHDHDAVHASHCHDTPGSCADAPVTAGPGQLLGAQPLLPSPELVTVLLLTALPVLFGITFRPAVRPPMQSARATSFAS